MIIKVLLILTLLMVELPSSSVVGKASRSVRAVFGSACFYLKPLSPVVDRWILKEDLPNFKKVSSEVYRGGQPLGDGYNMLKSRGIKTIINLRGIDTGSHCDESITYIHLPIYSYCPQKEDVVTFLKVINERKEHPVFIHCFHGSDRTGLFVAIYRVVYDGWTKQQAVDEMIHGGHGFHAYIQQNLIQFFQDLDLKELMQLSESHGLVGKSS